jgi:EpsI family protein
MEWTADFTVGALQLFGIPVLRDGLYFSTPNGNFYVAEACSGVRYLLASVATGTAFAFVAYTDWKKRVVFILAAIVTPIIANGIRAFGIVMIAHYSNMQLAIGIDHFIYGWLFFGIVMLLLFWVGSLFADHDMHEVFDSSGPGKRQESEAGTWKMLTGGVLIAFVIGLGPALSESRHTDGYEQPMYVPAGTILGDGWVGPFATQSAWGLGFVGATRSAAAAYRHGDVVVELRAAVYDTQTQGAELVNFQNRLAGADWLIENRHFAQVDRNRDSDFPATAINRGAEEYIVLHWYQYGAERTTSGYRAKWLELKSLFEPVPAMVVAIGVDPRNENAAAVLMEFVDVGSSSITNCFLAQEPGPTCMSPESFSDR